MLRAGGRLAVMVPTAGWAARFWRMLPNIGAHLFGEDEIGDILEDHGFTSVQTPAHMVGAYYERLGFRSRGLRRGYYTDNREDALIMWKDPVARGRR